MQFKSFTVHPELITNIETCGYITPTPIQEQAIPAILAGEDVLGLAQTGTGKTASFALPILQKLLSGPRKTVRALIVAPTRELAQQIEENFVQLGANTGLKCVAIYGGVGKQPQINAIRAGAEIVIACPGRLLDLMNDRHISLNRVDTLVLDEADHMFDKGFLPDIRRIIKKLPANRQSLVFSATMPAEIRHLVEEILRNHRVVQVNHLQPLAKIAHSYFNVAEAEKKELLKKLLTSDQMTSTVVFTRTKHKAKNLALQLEKSGVMAVSLQGNLSQQKRQSAINGFRNGTYQVLVATDIAARGIDVPGISHVINYDLPDTAATYVHRIGRTGRAESSGQAITFVGNDGLKMISVIERNLGTKLIQKKLDNNIVAGSGSVKPAEVSCITQKSGRHAAAAMPRPRRKRSSNFDFGLKAQSNIR